MKKIGFSKIKIVLILIPLVFLAASCNKQITPNVTIAGHVLNVDVARTPQEQAQGLGGRASMPENDGMIFIFQTPGQVAFWMKDTMIPLDFIWVRNGKVVEITPNVLPQPDAADADLIRYMPSVPVDSTIEVNAGWSAKNGIKVGDWVFFK
ncbi:MAG: DUF192 domain-containing protein [Candidatus Doudnabacteria bacterium]